MLRQVLSRVCTILVFNQPPRLTQLGHPSGVGRFGTSESWGVNRSPRDVLTLLSQHC